MSLPHNECSGMVMHVYIFWLTSPSDFYTTPSGTPSGYLFITGRIKELLITRGGENIAPVPIEERMLDQMRLLGRCMVIGDNQKFLTMFVTLRAEVRWVGHGGVLYKPEVSRGRLKLSGFCTLYPSWMPGFYSPDDEQWNVECICDPHTKLFLLMVKTFYTP